MPTGWRPKDVAEKYPVPYTTDIYHRPKYETQASPAFKVWSGAQLIITLLLMMYLFNNIGEIPYIYIIIYGIFLFVTIFAYTSLMDGSVLGVVGEGAKLILGFSMMYMNGNSWFNIEKSIPHGTLLVAGYLLVSGVVSVYFYFADRPVEKDILEFNEAKVV